MANGCSGVLRRHRCTLTSKAISCTIPMLCQIIDTPKSATKLGVYACVALYDGAYV